MEELECHFGIRSILNNPKRALTQFTRRHRKCICRNVWRRRITFLFALRCIFNFTDVECWCQKWMCDEAIQFAVRSLFFLRTFSSNSLVSNVASLSPNCLTEFYLICRCATRENTEQEGMPHHFVKTANKLHFNNITWVSSFYWFHRKRWQSHVDIALPAQTDGCTKVWCKVVFVNGVSSAT